MLLPLDSASADEVTVNLDAQTAFVDIPVSVDTSTVYSITTQTGARFEVVNNQSVERLAWVDSWIELRQGDLVLRADDDSNHNSQTNYYASSITGTIEAGTYIIRATSYDYVVAQQRPIGTYTVTSNLIVVEPTPAPSPSTAPTPQPTPQPTASPEPSATPTAQPQPTASPSSEPSPTPNVPTPSPTSESTSTPTPTPQPSVTPTPQPAPTPQPEPSIPVPILLPFTEPAQIQEESMPLIQEPAPIEPIDSELPVTEVIVEPPVGLEELETIQQESQLQEQDNPLIETLETSEVIDNALTDGQITPADAEAVVDSLMLDGVVTEAEATALIETLTDGGALTGAEESLIVDALSADGEITQDEVNNLSETLSEDGNFTESERELVAEVLIESAEGQAVTVEAIAEAGITLQDLPPAQPVEVRQDENGNEVVITAEVAVALELLTSAGDIVSAIFESPAELLFAIGNLGADMSPEERKEASETIIAATIVGNIATTTMATAIGSVGYRRQK